MSTKRILYIEDDQPIRCLIGRILDRSGYQFLQAEDGEEGVEMATREHPDLILLDIHLPGGMSGVEVATQLRSSVATMNIPIIAITADTVVHNRNSVIDSGCDDYISKPFDREFLMATINRHLSAAN